MKLEITRQESRFKRILYTAILALLTWSALFAQEVGETSRSMSLGAQNAFFIDIEGVDAKLTSKVWKKFFKDYGKVKFNKRGKEYYSMDATVGVINGSNPLNVYAAIDEGSGQSTMYMWVDRGGEFVNSSEHASEAQGAKNLLQDFRLAVLDKDYENRIKEQKKEVKNAKKQLVKLEKKNKNLHKDIEEYKNKIAQAEKDIEKNLSEQTTQKETIEGEERKLSKLTEYKNSLGKE